VSENPWRRLPAKSPFVLPEDQEKVQAFNLKQEKKAGPKHPLFLALVPEAFIGRPEAPLVLLGNISGVSESGDEPAQPRAYRLKPAFMERMRNNLLHNEAHTGSKYPFIYFDPKVNPPVEDGEDWWDRKLEHVLAEFSTSDAARSILARNLFAVEFFPYVSCSSRYAHDSLRLPSQEYSFGLVRDALKREPVIVSQHGERRGLGHGPVIVLRHGERRWLEKVPELVQYPRLVRLKAYFKGLISPNNCAGNGWSYIRELVRTLESVEAGNSV